LKAFQLVHPENAAHATRVDADIRLEGSRLSARFQVRSARPVSSNPGLPSNQSQWGLWDWDVVELFVSCTPGRLPYYEFQVSPLGQHFELEIHEPRKRFNREFRSGFTYSARHLSGGDWDAEMSIPLTRLGWDGDPASITGNAFAILGPSDARTYWSLFEGQQVKPDFHIPHRFHRLG
jgi:hypothetical protein